LNVKGLSVLTSSARGSASGALGAPSFALKRNS
jgi:hypothetical protein